MPPESEAPAVDYHRQLHWALLLVAVGTAGMAACLVLNLVELLVLPDLTRATLLLVLWVIRLRWLAGCVLLVGFLLSVYVPPRYRVVRYAMLAAALQLVMMSRLLDWLPISIPSFVDIAIFAFLPSLASFWPFVYLYSLRADHPLAAKRLKRVGLVGAVVLGLCAFAGFAATAGDTIGNMINPYLFIEFMCCLLLGIAYAFFSWQLLLVRGELGKLESPTASSAQPGSPGV